MSNGQGETQRGMGVLRQMIHPQKKRAMWQLSGNGHRKLQDVGVDGTGLKWGVMWYLKDNSTSSTDEVARELNVTKPKIQMILGELEEEMMVVKVDR